MAGLSRRAVMRMAAALASTGGAGTALAETYPAHSVRFVIPFGTGGATNLFGRLLSDGLAQRLKQPFVAENRPAAGGVPGTALLARSSPDGYTLGIGSIGTHGSAPSLFRELPYNPEKDFTPITIAADFVLMAVVGVKTGFERLADLIRAAKEKPDTVTYGSIGIGSSQHLSGELFQMLTGLKMRHVPYREYSTLLLDLMQGRVALSFDNLVNTRSNVEAGALRILAVARPERWDPVPNVPTFEELGVRGFDISSWVALFGPKGLPEDIVRLLNGAAHDILTDPPIAQRFAAAGAIVGGGPPEALRRRVESEIKRWSEVVKYAKIQPQ